MSVRATVFVIAALLAFSVPAGAQQQTSNTVQALQRLQKASTANQITAVVAPRVARVRLRVTS